MTRHVVARAGEISDGSAKAVTVAGREIGIFHVNGRYFALLNRCPHEGAPLCRGRLSPRIEADAPGAYRVSRPGEMLRCPWHGWEFDIHTGQSFFDPAHTFVRSYKAHLERGGTLMQGPYVAETFPVEVDGDYVVVEL